MIMPHWTVWATYVTTLAIGRESAISEVDHCKSNLAAVGIN